ncbi:MAG: hypothetical protein JWL70_1685 [Acidimicrobiia bacterium]|nr:hypothetical protein [Acidimicrobiia bacterium]
MRLRPVLVPLSLAVALGGCSHDGRTLRPAQPDQTQSIVDPTTTVGNSTGTAATGGQSGHAPVAKLTVKVEWGSDGSTVAKQYTCDGGGTSPAVSWSGVPSTAAEIGLAMVDDDAKRFVHWVVGGLPAVDGSMPAGGLPQGAIAGVNGAGTTGWTGPCPPPGSPHHYRLTIYALDEEIGLGGHDGGTPTIDQFVAHALAQAESTATYGRAG